MFIQMKLIFFSVKQKTVLQFSENLIAQIQEQYHCSFVHTVLL